MCSWTPELSCLLRVLYFTGFSPINLSSPLWLICWKAWAIWPVECPTLWTLLAAYTRCGVTRPLPSGRPANWHLDAESGSVSGSIFSFGKSVRGVVAFHHETHNFQLFLLVMLSTIDTNCLGLLIYWGLLNGDILSFFLHLYALLMLQKDSSLHLLVGYSVGQWKGRISVWLSFYLPIFKLTNWFPTTNKIYRWPIRFYFSSLK